MACQNCVATDLNQCYSACSGDGDCMDWCDEMNYKYQGDCGRSLPLDAPLWFLLVGVVILSAAKNLTIYVRHSEGLRPKSLASSVKSQNHDEMLRGLRPSA